MSHVHSYSVGPDAGGNYWLESHGQRIGGPYKSTDEADTLSKQVSQKMGENPVNFYIDWLKDNHPKTGGWSDALGLKQYASEQFGDMEFEMEILTPGEPGAWKEPDPLLKSGVDANVAEYIDVGLNDRVAWPHLGIQTDEGWNSVLKTDAEFAAHVRGEEPRTLYNKLSKNNWLRNDQGFDDWVGGGMDDMVNSTDFVALFNNAWDEAPDDTWRHEFRHRGYDRTVASKLNLTKAEEETLMRNYDLIYGGKETKKEANDWLSQHGEAAPFVEDVNAMAQPQPEPEVTPISKLLSLFN